MTWVVSLPDGQKVESDDFTLADLIAIEKETGTPWSILNPYKDGSVAIAFYRTALRMTDGDPKVADSATLKDLKRMFEFVPDEPIPSNGEGEEVPLDLKAASSSIGAQSGTAGHRRKRAASA